MIRDIVDKGHKIVGYSVRGIQSQIQVRHMKGYKLTDKTIEQYHFSRILIVIKNINWASSWDYDTFRPP